jgi:hypothetical protein
MERRSPPNPDGGDLEGTQVQLHRDCGAWCRVFDVIRADEEQWLTGAFQQVGAADCGRVRVGQLDSGVGASAVGLIETHDQVTGAIVGQFD